MGMQTMSSLQMGTISIENDSFLLVVAFFSSTEMSCSDIFDLRREEGQLCVERNGRKESKGVLDRSDGREEVDHLEGMLLGTVEEVESVLDLGDRNGVLVRAVLEDELLQVEEGAFVVNLLPHLDHCSPGVFRRQPCALGALGTRNDVLDLEDLLENRRREDLARESSRVSSCRGKEGEDGRENAPPSESST